MDILNSEIRTVALWSLAVSTLVPVIVVGLLSKLPRVGLPRRMRPVLKAVVWYVGV